MSKTDFKSRLAELTDEEIQDLIKDNLDQLEYGLIEIRLLAWEATHRSETEKAGFDVLQKVESLITEYRNKSSG